MDDITNGLQGAISVVEYYQKWRKGDVPTAIYSPAEISIALEIVTEAAKVLLILEQIKNQQAEKK